MFNLLNPKTKVKLLSENNGIREYTILFSRKKDSNIELLKEILRQNYLYVHIDTSLCFLNYDQAEKKASEIMKLLQDFSIELNHRISEDTSNRDTILGSIKLSNTKRNCSIITFILPKDFNNDFLIKNLFEIGFMIYAPIENDYKEVTLDKVFWNKFKTEDEKSSSFNYSIFLTDYISQSTITTKYLFQPEIEKIFLKSI